MSQAHYVLGAAIAICAGLASVSAAASTAPANNCAVIEDDSSRLACYDGLFRAPSAQAEKPQIDELWQDFGNEGVDDETLQVDKLVSTVVHLSRRTRDEIVMHLDNDQVWTQTLPRLLTIKEGDGVIIRRARFGGYILTTERGGTTRVKRLR